MPRGNEIPLGGNGIMNGENESLSLLFLIRATNRGVFLLYKKLKAFLLLTINERL
jgi:hypothetical protein